MQCCARSLAAGLTLAAGCAAPSPWHLPGDSVARELRRELEAGAAAVPDAPARLPAARRPPQPPQPGVWVELERPAGGPAPPVVHTAWLEVAGLAGTRDTRSYDVVVAIDASGSTRYASGADVDGDGVVGERRARIRPGRLLDPSLYSSDPDDSVLDAERVATRRLVERLDPRRTRIGLVSFSDLARPRAALGSSRELLGLVLDDLGEAGAGPTNLASATRLASRMLKEAGGAPGVSPDRLVLILSDGYPTHPGSEAQAAEAALAAAREAAAAGIRVSSLALGIDAPRERDVFAEMARESGGEHLRVLRPGDVLEALPGIDLARVAGVEIRNLTSGADARALRLRPDGGFDAYLRLRPGENRLRVAVRGDDGAMAELERRVVYDDRRPPDPEELLRLRRALTLRGLALEARAGRAAQRKELRVEAEPTAAE